MRFSKDVFKLLMGRDPTGLRDTISWVQFKNYRSVCQKRIEMIKREINLFSIEVKTEVTKSILRTRTSQDGSAQRSKNITPDVGMSNTISKVQTPKRNESLANMKVEENVTHVSIIDDEMDSILDPEELLDNPRTINASKNEN